MATPVVKLSVPASGTIAKVMGVVAAIHRAKIGGKLHIALPEQSGPDSDLEREELLEVLEQEGFKATVQGDGLVVPV